MAATVHSIRRPARAARYRTEPGTWDEAFAAPGVFRPGYEGIFACLEEGPPARIAASVAARLSAKGVEFGGAAGPTAFPIDPIPRLLGAEEWALLEAGLIQRARALDAFLADAYGERRIVAAGVLEETVITGSPLYEPQMAGVRPAHGIWTHVCGFDVVRDAAGELLVLEDNLRTPSGISYALALRRELAIELPLAHFEPLPIEGAIDMLRATLAGSAVEGCDEPNVVVLSDGPGGSAWYEHRALAAALGVPLITPSDLDVSGDRLWFRRNGVKARIDVVYRRTDQDKLSGPGGKPTELGELLAGPLRAANVSVANAFGAGVADDKLAHAHVEEMVRFYLSEKPLVRSVATFDLGQRAQMVHALERLDELVFKPREGAGGAGVQIGAELDREQRERLAGQIRSRPRRFIAQERIALSTHPTIAADRLEPRRVDLRPYVMRTPAGFAAVPGGLTRYAPAGSMLVNSSRGGGGKDTWVVA